MRVARWLGVVVSVVGLALGASLASAQPAPEGARTAHDETLDVADLIRILRKKPTPDPSAQPPRKAMRAFSPVIGARPSSGLMAGVAGNLAFHTGDPASTRISSGVGSLTVSTRGQTSLTSRITMFGPDDAWRLETDDRFQWTSQGTSGLGQPAELSEPQWVDFDFFRVHQSVHARLRRSLYVGGGLHYDIHTNVTPGDDAEDTWATSPYVEYSADSGLPLDRQTSAGPSLEVLWDSRDSFINPDRGWQARVSYRWLFEGFLGGSSQWDKMTVDVRAYPGLSPSGRHKLAVWLYADLVVRGIAPYFDLPSTGNDTYGRSGRGYAEGHFRGERLAFAEAEYRGRLTRNGLLGLVVFLNATTVADLRRGQQLFDRLAPGGGAGLRLLINKRSRTNLAFDVGFGERGNKGVYLAVQEAF